MTTPIARDSAAPWTLLMVLPFVLLPFGLAAAAGATPPVYAGLLGGLAMLAAGWKTQEHHADWQSALGVGVAIGALFVAMWFREAWIEGWSRALLIVPLAPFAATTVLAGIQIALRNPSQSCRRTASCAWFSAAGAMFALSIVPAQSLASAMALPQVSVPWPIAAVLLPWTTLALVLVPGLVHLRTYSGRRTVPCHDGAVDIRISPLSAFLTGYFDLYPLQVSHCGLERWENCRQQCVRGAVERAR